jgi:oxygen-dependent protoporphyrinogen oxidase
VKNKMLLLTGVAVGYVLGSRAGREQYEKIRSQARSMWNNPKVQEQVSHAQDAVKAQAPVVQEKLTEATKKAADHAKSSARRDSSSLEDSGSGI